MVAAALKTEEDYRNISRSRLERYEAFIPDYREVPEDMQEPIHRLTYFIINGSFHSALEIALENNFNHDLISQLKRECGLHLELGRKERRSIWRRGGHDAIE